MRAIFTWIINFLVGIVGAMTLVSRMTGTGQGVRGTSTSVGVDFRFGLTELVFWVILMALYFWLPKKYLGKSFGGWLIEKIFGKKK